MDIAKHFTIGYVQWVDALSDSGWETDVKVDVHPCLSIGFIVDETEDAICLAAALSYEQSNSRIHIPKSWIKSVKRVTLDKFLQIGRKTSKPKVQKQKAGNSSNGSEINSSTDFLFPRTM
jgi:ADP-ribosylglycohydrolase